MSLAGFAARIGALCLCLAIFLSLAYRIFFVSQVIGYDRPIAMLADALWGSLGALVALVFASAGPLIAFSARLNIVGRVCWSIFSGAFVALMCWFTLSQVGGFPLFAGAVVSVAFFLFLAFLPGRSSNRSSMPSSSSRDQ